MSKLLHRVRTFIALLIAITMIIPVVPFVTLEAEVDCATEFPAEDFLPEEMPLPGEMTYPDDKLVYELSGGEVGTHTVTIENSPSLRDGEHIQMQSGAGEYAQGQNVRIDAGTRRGYSFRGWMVTSDDSGLVEEQLEGQQLQRLVHFTMPNSDVAITANWERSPEAQYLDAPIIRLFGMALFWDSIADASGYRIYVNGEAVSVSWNWNLFYIFNELTDGDELRVRAFGFDNFLDSELSNAIIFDAAVAAKTHTVTIDNNPPLRDGEVITWQSGAGVYTGGQIVQIETGIRSGYSLTGLTVAVDDSGTVAEQVAEQLEGRPQWLWHLPISFIMPSDVVLIVNWERYPWIEEADAPVIRLLGTAIVWDSVENSRGYRVYLNGEVVQEFVMSSPFIFDSLNDGDVLQVRTLGEWNFLDSARSNAIIFDAAAQQPLQLDAPVARFCGITFTLTWESVGLASEYRVYVNGQAEGTTRERYFRFPWIDMGTEFRVIAIGDGNIFLDSKLSDAVIFRPSDTAEQLDAPGIRVFGTTIIWRDASNIGTYHIYINGEMAEVTFLGTRIFVIAGLADGTTLQVRAIGDGYQFFTSELSNAIVLPAETEPATQLDAPVIRIEGTTLRWDTIPNATSYSIYVNNIRARGTFPSWPELDISHYDEGTTFMVRANGDGIYFSNSEISNTVVFEFPLSSLPTRLRDPNIRIFETILSWRAIPNAIGYRIYVDGNPIEPIITGTTFDLSEIEGRVQISVRTIGDGVNFLDSWRGGSIIFDREDQRQQLDAPVISISGTTVSWAHLSGAILYIIYIDGVEVGTTRAFTTTFSFYGLGDGAIIQVRAISGHHDFRDSEFSNVVIFDASAPLPPPPPPAQLIAPVISMDGTLLRWSSVSGAVGYRLYINGIAQGRVFPAIPWLSSIYFGRIADGTTFEVRAIGNGITVVDSELSNTIVFDITTLPPRPIDAPVIRIFGTTISWPAVADAVGYRVYMNDQPIEEIVTGTTFVIDESDDGATFRVRAIGDGDIMLDSPLSNAVTFDSQAVQPPQLEAPVISITHTNIGMTLSWEPIDNANGYRIYVNGRALDTTFEVPWFNFLGTLDGTMFQVRALGDGINFSDSMPSNIVIFTAPPHNQLPSPIIEMLSFSADGLILSWMEVANAISYRVYVDGVAVGTTTATMLNLAGLVGSEGKLQVRALGDGDDFLDSALSTPMNFNLSHPMQLATPTISISGTTLNWTAVPNAVGYRIYVNGEAFEGVVTGTTFNLIDLASGTTLEVRALGDAIKFSDSELSNTVVFTAAVPQPQQLPAPIISISGTSLSWTANANAAEYRIYANGVVIGTTLGASFSLAGVTNGTALRVRALGDGTNFTDSVLSNEVIFTAQAPPASGAGGGGGGGGTATQVPSRPRDFVVTTGDGSAILEWSVPSSTGGRTITRFEVSNDGGRTWRSVGSDLSYTFTGLVNGNTYDFRVRAITSAGNGLQANERATPATSASIDTPPVTLPVASQIVPSVVDEFPFIDVDSSVWYYQSVRTAWEHSLFAGTAPNLFSSQLHMTRAMFAQVLANLTGIDLESYANAEANFDDVDTGAWYFAAIEWAVELGIVTGMGEDTFAPHSPITREQMALILYRYVEIMSIELVQDEMDAFTDQNAISYWAMEAVAAIQAAGIVTGRPDGIFDPKATATRAEGATIFTRLLTMM